VHQWRVMGVVETLRATSLLALTHRIWVTALRSSVPRNRFTPSGAAAALSPSEGCCSNPPRRTPSSITIVAAVGSQQQRHSRRGRVSWPHSMTSCGNPQLCAPRQNSRVRSFPVEYCRRGGVVRQRDKYEGSPTTHSGCGQRKHR